MTRKGQDNWNALNGIRNCQVKTFIGDELVERIVNFVRIKAFDGSQEAKELMAEIDPDLELASEAYRDYLDGKHGTFVYAALAAIKRVRAEYE